ncbi:MAG: hypothetical protein VYA60_05135 [Pseudomonadota bacterium]|nr:hypothetical protein [Pseudomonadota bacterium]
MGIHARKIRKFKKLDDAVTYTALYMGITDKIEVAKMMALTDHLTNSKISFAKRLADSAPLKTNSIDINQSRFERLNKSNNKDEFIENLKICLRIIDYDCSKQSVVELIEKFFDSDDFERDPKNRWNYDLSYIFYSNQKKVSND